MAAEAAFINELFSSTNDDDNCPSLSEGLSEKIDQKEKNIPEFHGAQVGQGMIKYSNSYNPPISEYRWGVGNSIWTLQNHEPAAQVLRSSTKIDTPYRKINRRRVGKEDTQLKIEMLPELLDQCRSLCRKLKDEFYESQ